MERLNAASPTVQLTDLQKRQIAELDSRYRAKLAEREIFLQAEIAKAAGEGKFDEVEQFERQLTSDRKALAAELEEAKEKVRHAKA
jgi:hypothetical protein